MSAELKPCPWCGVKPECAHDYFNGRGDCVYALACSNMECPMEAIADGNGTKEDAMRIWNTRAPQWLPIESAPTDGTRVLLWDTAKGGYAISGAWVVGSPDDHETFTHWQPLPAAPEVQP